MICGVYDGCGQGDALRARARLNAVTAEMLTIERGPLSIGAAGPFARIAEVDGVTCAVDGRVYEVERLAADLGVEAGDEATLLALAYRRLGTPMLERLRGTFSLVVWDNAPGRGVLSCDLLATRQLFFTRSEGAVVFATELHELLPLLPRSPAPDAVAFTRWLANGTLPEERTLYEGVLRLAPGMLIQLGTGVSGPQHYWRPEFAGSSPGQPLDLADGLRAELERSTQKRLSLRANAVILSGGLDSSIVTAMAQRTRSPSAALKTYSAVFPGADFDESGKIRALTEGLQVDAATLSLRPQGTLWLALRYTQRWQLPLIAAGSLIDIVATSQAARDDAEVVLDGQTGDEVFGLSPYLVADCLRHGRLPGAWRLAGSWPIGRPTSLRNKLWILKELGVKGAAPYRLGRYVLSRRDRSELAPPWMRPHLRPQFVEMEDRWAWKLGSSGPLWWRYLADTLVYEPHRELRMDYLRQRALGEGVVNESPLYDVDLIDYCLRLPPELAFDSRFDRPFVRQAMSGWLPEEVRLQTKKANFTPFFEDAMTSADAAGIGSLLEAPDAEIGAYADLDWVRTHWRSLSADGGDARWIGTVWRLAAGECWLRAQGDAGFIDQMLARPDVPAPAVERSPSRIEH
jgi:asparagine synthase (glutamine-hydrolysing)